MSGRSPNLPVDVMLGKPLILHCSSLPAPESVGELQSWMKTLFVKAQEQLPTLQAHQKLTHDQYSRYVSFQMGIMVLLHNPTVPKRSTKKFFSHWKEPFIILDKLGDVNYCVQSLVAAEKRLNVHVNRLKPYQDNR